MKAENDGPILNALPESPEARGSANPITLNAAQESAVKEWAADDRLWTTQETVEFNLRIFARVILKADSPNQRTSFSKIGNT